MADEAGAGRERFRVLVLNQIAASGLQRLPQDRYQVDPSCTEPDAILVRSADLHQASIADSVKAIGRAGALNTGTPRRLIALTGMLLVPAPARPIALTESAMLA